MKGLKNLVRLHRWRLEEKRRELLGLERLAEDLRNQSRRLDEELAAEQAVARATAEGGYAYGNYAAAVIRRRTKLAESIARVERQVAASCEQVADAFQELKKYELALAHRERAAEDKTKRREQGRLDELGVQMFARRRRRGTTAAPGLAVRGRKAS